MPRKALPPSVDAILQHLESKQLACTRLQALIRAATQTLELAHLRRDKCKAELERELTPALRDLSARRYIRSSLGTELQRAQGELDIATDLLDCKKPALAAKEQELRRYKREVSNWYRALNRQMPEEVVEQMAKYTFSQEPGASGDGDDDADSAVTGAAHAASADNDRELFEAREKDEEDERMRRQLQNFLLAGPQYGIHMNPSSGTSHHNLQDSDP